MTKRALDSLRVHRCVSRKSYKARISLFARVAQSAGKSCEKWLAQNTKQKSLGKKINPLMGGSRVNIWTSRAGTKVPAERMLLWRDYGRISLSKYPLHSSRPWKSRHSNMGKRARAPREWFVGVLREHTFFSLRLGIYRSLGYWKCETANNRMIRGPGQRLRRSSFCPRHFSRACQSGAAQRVLRKTPACLLGKTSFRVTGTHFPPFSRASCSDLPMKRDKMLCPISPLLSWILGAFLSRYSATMMKTGVSWFWSV